MTNAPAPGSAPAGNPTGSSPAPAPAPTPPPGGQGTVEPGGNWLDGLETGNRELAVKKGWDKSKSPDVVLASYRDLETKLGSAVVIPSAEAPQTEQDAFYERLGRPKTAGEYAFRLPSDVPGNIPYDDAFATEFKNEAFASGLRPAQAQHIHDFYVRKMAKSIEANGVAVQKKVTDAHTAIVGKWGADDTAGYKQKVDYASRALRNLDLSASFKAAGLITQNGQITDPKLAFALAAVGEGLFKEDNQHGDPGALSRDNPWKEGAENLSEQGRIFKENPELARTLVKAAGKDPDKVLYQGR